MSSPHLISKAAALVSWGKLELSPIKSLRLSGTQFASLAIAAILGLSGCSAGSKAQSTAEPAGSPSQASDAATVVRIIDGDTFVASTAKGEATVRLLNVDTPETKDPNEPVQCLGPEASAALAKLLPVGSNIRLETDKEALDKYGRLLAGVFDGAGRLINAEVARQGLGVPVVFEPNRKFYPPVVDAFEEARKNGSGLNSASIGCLPAQQVESASRAVEAIVAAPLAETDEELDRSHTALATAIAGVAALKAAGESKKLLHWSAYPQSRVDGMLKQLTAASASGSARQSAIASKKKAIADAAAEAARQAEEARAAAAAATAEAERIRNLPPAPAPYVPPAYVPPAYVPPAYVAPEAPAPVTNPYPGYTGPRCYAPGGKSWTPCSKK